MLKKVDHIGIVVESLENTIPLYRDTLGLPYLGSEIVPDGTVKVAFFQSGDIKIELIESISNIGVEKFLEKRGQGMHHICFETDNIDNELSRLKAEGVALIDQTPRDGAHNMRVAFAHPKSLAGLLMELAEPKDKKHA